MKNGLLLINLGTPDDPSVSSVKRYLREFLTDKRVISLSLPLRYLLVYGVILPTRARRSAHAYQTIWTQQGSPLRYYSQQLTHRLQTTLYQKNYKVALGMRYGNPSLREAFASLAGCEKIVVLPLYPQYASATTGSSIEEVLRLLASQHTYPSIQVIRDFYAHESYIHAQAEQIKPYINQHDHLLFSYHGIPEYHLLEGGCHAVCASSCPIPKDTDTRCYRAQCFHTSALLANTCGLMASQYSTSFQSRLGKTPWIRPYTDEILVTLIEKGIRRLAIACPSFVTDCLETLEEIGIRAKQQWERLGGEQLTLIPCMNDEAAWVQAIIKLIDR